jgi:competence protein ComEC
VAWLAAPRGVPGRALGAVWFLPLFVVLPARPEPSTFRMTVLDVGQGLAVVVETHRHTLLYDTGPRITDDADAGNRIIAPFLRATGVQNLSTLIVSHLDSDHSGGAGSLLQTVPVDMLLSSLPTDSNVLMLREADDGSARRCAAGEQWSWDGVRFAVLHPPEDFYDASRMKTNDLSCVIRIDSDHGSALLTGDIEARSETRLLQVGADVGDVTVLVVPHHGSRTSSSPAFVAATNPRHAVFTPGYRNRFGHPRPDVLARYAAAGARVHRTDYDGAVTFAFAPGVSTSPKLERLERRRYWSEAPLRDEAAVSRDDGGR